MDRMLFSGGSCWSSANYCLHHSAVANWRQDMMMAVCPNKFIVLCRVHSISIFLITLCLFYAQPLHGTVLRGLRSKSGTEESCEWHSQYKQDEFLEKNYFKGRKGGFYVDLGAHDPYDLSNTAYFDKCLKWNGLCVDANVNHKKSFEMERSCKFIGACLTDPKTQQATIRNMDSEDYLGSGTQVVKCMPIMDLLKDNNVKHIDYLSIDIEGHEWPVIQQLNFSIVSVSVISVETWHGNRTRIRDYLQDAGFVHAAEIGADDIYYWRGKPWLPEQTLRWRKDVRGIRPHKEY